MSAPTRRPIVLEAPGKWPKLGLRELWQYRSIGAVLTARNLKVRYRQTLLGVIWVVLQPLAYVVLLSIVFTLLRGPRYGIPAPIWFFTALVFFLPTAKILAEGTTSILVNKQLVSQIYVPRALIPLSTAVGSLVDMAILFVVFEGILLVFGYLPNARYLLLPLLAAIAFTAGTGLAYGMSAANTRYRDLQLMIPFITQMWFWTSPIFYPAQLVPEQFQPLYYLNPMAVVITSSRWIIADAPPPPTYAYVEAIVVSTLLLVFGYLFFKSREPNFADDL